MRKQCKLCGKTKRMAKVSIPPIDKKYNGDTKYNHYVICSYCGARQ